MAILEAVFLLVITTALGYIMHKLEDFAEKLSIIQRDIILLKLYIPKRKTDEQGKNRQAD